MKKRVITMMLACAVCSGQAQEKLKDGMMPQLPAFPEIPSKMPIGSVPMGDSESFAEVQLNILITDQLTISNLRKGKEDLPTSIVFKIAIK